MGIISRETLLQMGFSEISAENIIREYRGQAKRSEAQGTPSCSGSGMQGAPLRSGAEAQGTPSCCGAETHRNGRKSKKRSVSSISLSKGEKRRTARRCACSVDF